VRHGVLVVTSFFENVSRHAFEKRELAPGEKPQNVAAGHDRCVIPLREANLDAWLNPAGRATSELSQFLDDRSRPYYEHELAA